MKKLLIFITSATLFFSPLTHFLATNNTFRRSPTSDITWEIAYENNINETQALDAMVYLLESMGVFEDAMQSLTLFDDDLLQK